MTDSNDNSIPTVTLTIGASGFVRRQTMGSEFTHFDDDSKSLNSGEEEWDKVVQLAIKHFHSAKPGYRDGVCLVPVPGEHFHTGVVTLKEGDELRGRYEARRKGEEPRKTQRVHRTARLYPGPGAIERGEDPNNWRPNPDAGKQQCVAVDIVLYSRSVLEGEGEETTGADYDIVAVNGRITEAEQPIHPDTLIANHFGLDGGTPTNMTPEQFEAALRESILYWKDKAMLAP